ncbi:MAG: IS21 family transposase [Bacteroidota bacterium]
MSQRELSMYSVQDIINDLLSGKSIKKTARLRRISKNTVKKYRNILQTIREVHSKEQLSIAEIMTEFQKIRDNERYSENFGWLVENHKTVEELSSGCDNYIRLIEVLQEKGFKGSYSSLLRFINKNRTFSEKPIFRIETKAGEYAQVDFGYLGKIFDTESGREVQAYIFVMVLCFSRDAYYEIVKSQDIETWCNCHIHAFEFFGGVPKIIIPDNLKSAVIKASFLDPVLNRSYAALAEHYNFQIDPCIPYTPEHKGKVESGVKYAKRNFFPLRTFKDFTDGNIQLLDWNIHKARKRIHGTTRRMPEELFEQFEKKALTVLPHDRFEIPVWKDLKVSPESHIQFDKAHYSVPSEHIGKRVLARKTSSQVAIFSENKLISVHTPVKIGKRSTKLEHYLCDKNSYMRMNADYCLEEARTTGENIFRMVDTLINGTPIRNLRGAQHIIRLKTKYSAERLESACKRSLYFNNYTYESVKNILESGIENNTETSLQPAAGRLCSEYARDIKELLKIQEATYAEHGAN